MVAATNRFYDIAGKEDLVGVANTDEVVVHCATILDEDEKVIDYGGSRVSAFYLEICHEVALQCNTIGINDDIELDGSCGFSKASQAASVRSRLE